MKCGRAGCEQDGAWIPTLVLHPRRSLVTARFQVSTVVCTQHKSNNAEVYLSDESWRAFLTWFDERKLERPHRSLSKVDYAPLGDDEESDEANPGHGDIGGPHVEDFGDR